VFCDCAFFAEREEEKRRGGRERERERAF